jgi:coenzyme F420 hydrogenase subunit beta
LLGRSINTIRDVAENHLCLGCGACAYVQPEAIRMVDDLDQGRRPIVAGDERGRDLPTAAALAACPGLELAHPRHEQRDIIPELAAGWGPVLEVWEGHASAADLRFAASSGGAGSALALHCLEREGMHGLLHITARDDVPYLNKTVLSRTRAEILAATGSRYAPASPCDGLHLVEQAPAPCVFIGKPCDVAGADKARRLRPELDAKLGLTIALFCAGTPSTRGTLRMLEAMGVADPGTVSSVRYRGNGWPGVAEARTHSADGEQTHQLSYEDSWGGILQKHRQWRCYVCPDHTGEFADIAVGDPWYREIPPGEPGKSLILVRTERGRDVVRHAVAAGALTAELVSPQLLPASQPNLLRARGAAWGRIRACHAVLVPAPRFRNIPVLRVWWRHLSPKAKAQSLYGTLKRVYVRRLYRRRAVVEHTGTRPAPSVDR